MKVRLRRLSGLVGVSALTIALALVSTPTGAAAQTTSALDLANAMASAPGIITGASFVAVPPNGEPDAVETTHFGGFPTDGSSFALLTTGDSSLADTLNTSSSSGADDGGPNVRGSGDYDVSILKVDLNVPSNVNCLAGLDFRFLSEEYPEFVGSAYNDSFVAELDNSTWTTSGNSVIAPNNFAFDPAGNPISINSAGVTSMNAANAAGTTYDGATPLLSAATPITPGAHSLYLSIFDVGDHALDSAVMIDNLRLSKVSNVATQCAPGAKPINQTTYFSMGDSYSSGEGNPPFETGTDTQADSCHRSSQAWPAVASADSPLVQSLGNIACSGAKMTALTQSFKSEPPQISQLKAIESAGGAVPKVITITMGGNDLGFANILGYCYVADCNGRIQTASKALPAIGSSLTSSYEAIEKVFPQSRLLVVGYPNLFPTSQSQAVNCGWLTSSERPNLVALASSLDSTIRTAAQNAGAKYVSTLSALAGHELCTADSWVYPIGSSVTDLTSPLQGHPLASGQDAIAGTVIPAIQSAAG